MLRLVPLILALSLVPLAAHAGLGGLLSKLGSVGSKGGKVAGAGAKAAKVGMVGKAAAGVTGVVAAERAGALFAGLGDDAARSAAYVARTPEGELLMVTKAGGQTTHSAESLAAATVNLAAEPVIYLDRSAAAAEDVLAKLPSNAQLTLVEGGQKLPVRRSRDSSDFIVDAAGGVMDLSDYLDSTDDDSGEISSTWWVVLGVGVVAVAVFWRRRRATSEAIS